MACPTVTAEYLPLRLWSSVSIPTGSTNWLGKCWPWRGLVCPRRRTGKFRMGGRSVAPHKLAYIVFHGLNVDECAEMFVVQTCGNTLCCNPRHLALDDQCGAARSYRGTARTNEAKKQAAIAVPAARQFLPHEVAERIAKDWVRACMSRREVIETFGVEPWQVDDLKKRMAAGEFKLAKWQSHGLQQASGV